MANILTSFKDNFTNATCILTLDKGYLTNQVYIRLIPELDKFISWLLTRLHSGVGGGHYTAAIIYNSGYRMIKSNDPNMIFLMT